MLDAGRFEPFGLTLVQAYCYLTEFAGRPISDEKLLLLQASFDNLRQRGLKAVLRFAYEGDMDVKEGPTLDWILQHLDQLQPLLQRNADVIYVLQAGFIGAWGERHSAARINQEDYAARAGKCSPDARAACDRAIRVWLIAATDGIDAPRSSRIASSGRWFDAAGPFRS